LAKYIINLSPFSISKGSIVGTGKYKGATVGTSPAYGCSAQIAEVTEDEETGQITVDRITDAHDCGRAINVTSVEGQMEGSVSMGLGEALFEEVGEGAIMPTIPAILNAVYDGDLIVEHNDRFVYPQKYAEIAVRERDTFEFINPNIGG
jgi:CO/xanthine dehydrogenase Mo-binding subunit